MGRFYYSTLDQKVNGGGMGARVGGRVMTILTGSRSQVYYQSLNNIL
jgi:hypothetical protein